MKRGIKRLFCTNKVRVTIYLLVVILFVVSLSLFSISILRLNGIETLLRIVVLLLLVIYFVILVYKGYSYIIKICKIKYI